MRTVFPITVGATSTFVLAFGPVSPDVVVERVFIFPTSASASAVNFTFGAFQKPPTVSADFNSAQELLGSVGTLFPTGVSVPPGAEVPINVTDPKTCPYVGILFDNTGGSSVTYTCAFELRTVQQSASAAPIFSGRRRRRRLRSTF